MSLALRTLSEPGCTGIGEDVPGFVHWSASSQKAQTRLAAPTSLATEVGLALRSGP